MFKRIKARIKAAEYKRGYNWAITAFCKEKISVEDIEAYIHFSDSHFDKGAKDALSDIHQGKISFI